ncbi:MAG: hypothetical protein IJ192_14775 [Clostridia bacterium]|nr:hypothetical protein [Clostridia bacterium]
MSEIHDDDFYHGFDESKQGTDNHFFYTGYETNRTDNISDEDKAVAAAKMERMTTEYRSVNHYETYPGPSFVSGGMARGRIRAENIESVFPMPDPYAGKINDVEEFKEYYRDARIAVPRDILGRVIELVIIGLIVLFFSVAAYVKGINEMNETNRWIATAQTYEGSVVELKKLIGEYSLKYSFEYEGEKIIRTTRVSNQFVEENGLQEFEGHFDVYVHPEESSWARLELETYPPFWICLIALIGAVIVVIGIKQYLDVRTGKMITFTSEGKNVTEVRHYKRISKFNNPDPSVWG